MEFSSDGIIKTGPTIRKLNNYIDKFFTNLKETHEFYNESYSVLQSYRDDFFNLGKDKDRFDKLRKFQKRRSDCIIKSIDLRKGDPKKLPYISKCEGEAVEEEPYQEGGKVLYIIQKNSEEVAFEKMDHFFETYSAKMEHLHRMSIIYAFSINESFIKEIFHFFYLNYPETMISKDKKLSYDDFHSDRDYPPLVLLHSKW